MVQPESRQADGDGGCLRVHQKVSISCGGALPKCTILVVKRTFNDDEYARRKLFSVLSTLIYKFYG